MFRRSLFTKIFFSYSLVILVCMVAVGWYLASSSRNTAHQQLEESLRQLATLLDERFEPLLEAGGNVAADSLSASLGQAIDARITIIDADGVVLADTEGNPNQMENHAFRPEIQEALSGHFGSSLRFSTTMQRNFLYVAVPSQSLAGGVVRVAIPLQHFEKQIRATNRVLVTGTALAAVLALLLGLLVTRRITRPIVAMRSNLERMERGESGVRLEVGSADEVGQLAQTLNRVQEQLEGTIYNLRDQRTQLEAILASMVEGLLAVDAEGRLLVANKSARRMLQIIPGTIEGRPLVEVVRSPGLNGFLQRVRSSSMPRTAELALTHPTPRWLELHGARMLVEDRVAGAVVVLNDVTRLRRLEQSRKDFVANVSHELKTPITSIQGFVETLTEGGALDDTQNARRFLGIISKQTSRLSMILDDLLYLSRLESENVEIPLQPVNLVLVTTASVGNSEHLAKGKGIQLKLQVEDQPVMVPGSASLLTRALDNLIENAIKYSPDGGEVEVSVQQREGLASLAVRDHGIGISAEHLPRIAERFYRVDTARSRELGGTGLGLAIVKHVALVHHGKLDIESRVGEGSCFTLNLPLETLALPEHGPSQDS